MPPSAAAGSSKEVKLRKTCGRPILWCGGGTRIHNFFLPGDIPRLAISLGSWRARPVATSVARQEDKEDTNRLVLKLLKNLMSKNLRCQKFYNRQGYWIQEARLFRASKHIWKIWRRNYGGTERRDGALKAESRSPDIFTTPKYLL